MPIKISIPEKELYDDENEEFIYIKKQDISLEHSLVSLQKWEQRWKEPFLQWTKSNTWEPEKLRDYIRCMTITQNVDPNVYRCLSTTEINQIVSYISDPMTATTIRSSENHHSREIITAEIIYYWMIKFNIPQEYRKWHLNSLLMLIEVCGIKETPEKKRSQAEIANYHRQINAANRAKFHSKG